jgi:hypothetical protein
MLAAIFIDCDFDLDQAFPYLKCALKTRNLDFFFPPTPSPEQRVKNILRSKHYARGLQVTYAV